MKMPPSIEEYKSNITKGNLASGGRLSSGGDSAHVSGLVTVITAVLNSVTTLNRTIDSVLAQTHPAVQYIVVDGGSTDGTVELLRNRGDDVDLWLSEPDLGISDAFNKGIALSAGEYIALVNSDDWLVPTHLATAVEALTRSHADFVFGDQVFHSTDAQPPYVLRGERHYTRRLKHGMPHINHPTVVCRRRVYEEFGLFDTGLRAAMDYEWLLRGCLSGVNGIYVTGLIGHMSMGGISHQNYVQGLREVCLVSIRYGYPPSLARLRYFGRLLKTAIRLKALKWLPRRPYEYLRRMVNAHYTSMGGYAP